MKKIGVYGYGTGTGAGNNLGAQGLMAMMIMNGGGLFTADQKPDCVTDRNIEAMTFVKQLANEGIIDPGAVSYTTDAAVSALRRGPCRARAARSGVPKLAAKFSGRVVVGLGFGFAITAGGFVAIGFTQPSWRYAVFVLPLIAIAVGMGMSNGPASSASTACVPADQVGEASGVSNMARYVGAAVATALAASIYASVIANQTAEGRSTSEALSAGLGTASWVMAVFSVAGVVMALLMTKHRAAQGDLHDAAASAAAVAHTLPTSATSTAEPAADGH